MSESKPWSRSTRYFVAILLLGGLLWLMLTARPLLSPLAISALLAYVLNPAVEFVNTRTKLQRAWVVLLVFVAALAVIAVGIALVAPILPAQIQGLTEDLQAITLQVERVLLRPVVVLGFTIPLDQLLDSLPNLTLNVTRPDIILSIISATTTNLAWISIVVVTTYYLLQDWPRLREWLLNVAPSGYRADAQRLYGNVRDVWERYRGGQLRLMFIVGLLTGLGAAVIGLPGAVVFGILAGLLDVVLSVGPAIVMIVAAVVAYFSGSTWLALPNLGYMLLTLGVFGAIQVIENVWLRPRIMGNTLRLHPAVVFVAVIGALALGGVLLALIIVPLIGSAFVIVRYLYCRVFETDPWEDDPAQEETPTAVSTADSPEALA